MAKLIRVDRNGTKYYEGLVPCSRCEGKGIYYIGECNGKLVPSWVDQGVCFKCGGSGKQQGKWKEYTPEYQAKLDAKRKARQEQWEKEQAEERARAEAERKAKEEAERIAREAEEQRIREEKAISQHVGTVGERIDIDVTFIKRAWFDMRTPTGYILDTIFFYTFKDDKGNVLVWKTTKCLDLESGDKVHVRGTVKEHSDYKDEKQTMLTRCKIEEVQNGV